MTRPEMWQRLAALNDAIERGDTTPTDIVAERDDIARRLKLPDEPTARRLN